eukprot:2127706-Rhodomonas_salina.1
MHAVRGTARLLRQTRFACDRFRTAHTSGCARAQNTELAVLAPPWRDRPVIRVKSSSGRDNICLILAAVPALRASNDE